MHGLAASWLDLILQVYAEVDLRHRQYLHKNGVAHRGA